MGRLADGLGIDAEVKVQEQLAPDSILLDFAADVQLKATSQEPTLNDDRYSFSLDLPLYNRLRNTRTTSFELLVLMFLPESPGEWLSHSEGGLTSRRCAYWASLKGAAASKNEKHQTVYVPKANVLSPASLRQVMTKFSRQEEFLHGG